MVEMHELREVLGFPGHFSHVFIAILCLLWVSPGHTVVPTCLECARGRAVSGPHI